jgi:outer membrane lipoprotein-sorting protein
MYKVIPLTILQCLFLTGGQVLLKFALMRMAPFGWNRAFWSSVLLNWQFAACGLCFLIASLLWMYIVKTFPFSVAYPMVSMSFVIGMIAAVVFFHEQVSWTKWVGVLLIVAGCLFIAGPVQAQDTKAARQHIVDAAKGMKTMQCDFVQTKQTKLLSAASVSTGRLYYRQPDRLRWEYLTPTAHTFEIDGQKVIMSDSRGSREVDIRRNRKYREMARLMTNIMSAQSFVDEQDFQVSLAQAGKEWIATLIPRRKEVRHIFSSIILRVTPDQWLVHQVELVEPKGDRTVIELKNVKVN